MTLTEALLVGACAIAFVGPLIPAAWTRMRKVEPLVEPPKPVNEVVVCACSDDEDDEDDDLDEADATPPRSRVNVHYIDRSTFSFEPTAPVQPQTPKAPGRQVLKMPEEIGPFGERQKWSRPFPSNANSAAWSDLHRFAPGADQQRDPRGAYLGQEPPVAMVCPGCELEQPPLRSEAVRGCPYCGLKLRLFGARVFWWREAVEVEAWSPSDGGRS